MHSITAGYERLGSENRNILVFLYTDKHLGNIYEVKQFDIGNKNANVIHISCPNAAELKNMLMYFKVNYGLKINLRELQEVSLALWRAMKMSPEHIRIKDIYVRLEEFDKNKLFNVNACYELLGVKKQESAHARLEGAIGMKTVKKVLEEYNVEADSKSFLFKYLTSSRVRPNLKNPKENKEMIHFVLTGNPGTGKTMIAKIIGQLFFEMGYLENGIVVETDRSKLVGSHVGETAILTRAQVESAMGGVLFIDEAYSLKRQRDTGNDFGQEAIDTLCKLMDQYKGKFIVVAAGYQKEMEIFLKSNPGLASRFRKIHIDDYSAEEMCQILKFHAQKNGLCFSEELDSKLLDFCENWVSLSGENWGNAREAVNLIDNMTRACKRDSERETIVDEDGKQYLILKEKYIPDELIEYLRPVSEMREEMLHRLDKMTGLKEVKNMISKLRNRMISGDVKEPGNYMFVGNPGTGKTTVARYMGQILRNLGMLKRGHVVEYTASSLMAEMFNDENRGNFYEVAKRAFDGVLFIDEAYQLVTDTTGRGKPVLDALLPFMENNRKDISVIVAGYEDEMKDFLDSNKGYKDRFKEIIRFENYTGLELQEITLKLLEKKGITAEEGYKENALRALTKYVEIHGKEKSFGNARYIRDVFLPDCLDAQTDRLMKEYGENFSRDLKRILKAEDISSDLVRFTKTPLEKPDNRSAMEKLDSLIGYEAIKEELSNLLKTAKFNQTNELGIVGMPERLHWVLEGNPGTGKSMIAQLIGQVYKECGILEKGHTYKVTRSDLVAEYEGQTSVKTRRCIEKAMGGVLFIDEAYSLTKIENGNGGFGQEAIIELVDAMESFNGEFAVVCAGYPADMEDFLKTNSGLSSRMKKFVLEDYTPEELVQIFLLKCKKENTVVDEELRSKLELFFFNKKCVESKKRDWGNGREVENLLIEMHHKWVENQTIYFEEDGRKRCLLTADHLPVEQQKFLEGKTSFKKIEESAIDSINNLIGFEEVKNRLRDLLDLKEMATKQDREDLLEDINFHWVLRGNPGTGKTTVAQLIGKVYKEMGLLSHGQTVKVTRTDLVAEYVGQTAIKTQKCIDRAIGGVLFIDEAYSLKRTGTSGNDFGCEAIDTLMEQMSARNGEFAVIVAGYPKEMDTFLGANPGLESRFEDNFLLDDYTADELLQIFEKKCNNKKFYLSASTREVIKQLFQNMISAKSKNWANAREAENLEKRMRSLWVKNPVSYKDEVSGEMRSYYTIAHLPEKYKIYLTENFS